MSERDIINCQFKLRNPNLTWLGDLNFEVNQVWNYANNCSFRAIRKYVGSATWLNAFELGKLVSGFQYHETDNPNGFKNLGSASAGAVLAQYVSSRVTYKKVKLKWRVSGGSGKSLGWIPFVGNDTAIAIDGARCSGRIQQPVWKQFAMIIMKGRMETFTLLETKKERLINDAVPFTHQFSLFYRKLKEQARQESIQADKDRQSKKRAAYLDKEHDKEIKNQKILDSGKLLPLIKAKNGKRPRTGKDKDITIKIFGRHIPVFNSKLLRDPIEKLDGKVVAGEFSQDAVGDWYLNLKVSVDAELHRIWWLDKHDCPEIAPNEVAGIDLGVKRLATISDGTHDEALRFGLEMEEKLGNSQRRGHKKAVKRIHRKVRRRRNNALHKKSLRPIRNNQIIKIGDMGICSMKMRKKKTKEQKTRENQTKWENRQTKKWEKAKAEALAEHRVFDMPKPIFIKKEEKKSKKYFKPHFGKGLTENSPGTYKQLISSKCHWAGRTVQIVSESYTSQVCSNCFRFTGPKGLEQLGVRSWTCHACGKKQDRDHCSAKDISMVAEDSNLINSVPRCNHFYKEKLKRRRLATQAAKLEEIEVLQKRQRKQSLRDPSCGNSAVQ